MERGIANSALRTFLFHLREAANKRGLSRQRLPPWVTAADVRTGWIRDALVAVFEPSLAEDRFRSRGLVGADTVVLMDAPDFVTRRFVFDPRSWEGQDTARSAKAIVVMGDAAPNDEGGRAFGLVGQPRQGLYAVGYCGRFRPICLVNMFMEWGVEEVPWRLAVRYVPFALNVHANDLEDPDLLWNQCESLLIDSLAHLHDGAVGDYFASRDTRFRVYGTNRDKGVIVLGKYGRAPTETPELQQVRDALTGQGFDAHLILDLPEHPTMSLTDKVAIWTRGSRFVVVVDRAASGHLTEWPMLKEQESVVALLRPRGKRSTFMVGHESSIGYRFIRLFEFDESPLEVIGEAAVWADAEMNERARSLSKEYPWRTPSDGASG